MNLQDIELLDVYQRVGSVTLSQPIGIARITIGKNKFLYLIPTGVGVECEDGHHIYSMTQEGFDKNFSLSMLEVE